ncbi:hypothetical protein [Ciceribacter azotifigens]|uniref:hypothetical protein n=1 Tax=Ciceribacter azotifigens TaxID=2069303 RepID=UPI003A844FBE
MGEIRGEKVRFSKKDIVPLHDLPSARAEDPLIVHCPARSTWLGRTARFIFGLFLLAAILSGGFFVVIESGALDATFAGGAQRVLNGALAPQYRAEISGTAVRFSKEWKLAVEARDVSVYRKGDGLVAAETEAVRLVVDPIALLSGRFSVSEIEADGVSVDESLFSSGPPLDFTKLRVDAIPTLLEAAFTQLDLVQSFISKGGLDRMRLDGLEIAMGKARARPVLLSVRNLMMERGVDASLTIAGILAINGYESPISAKATNADGLTRSFSAWIGDVRLTPFLLRRDSHGDPRQGYDGSAEVTISARRGTAAEKPAVSMIAQTHDGTLYQDGNPQDVTRGTLNFAYDFSKDTIEVASSRIDFGPMVMPISGGLIDLDRLPGSEAAGPGIGIDLLVDQGLASVPSAGEQPFPFSFKIFGRFLYDTDELQLDTLSVSTPMGQMTGSLRARFFEGEGPEISFGARFANMQTTVIKQLWPYWIADKPRRWVLANIFGGTVTEGSVQVFIPRGRMSVEPRPLHLDANELQISFDIVNARMNVTGDIPPLRDTDAHFELAGPKVTTIIKSATSYFPSGRSVKVEGGELVLGEIYTKPLMADIKIAVAGSADSVAELVSFRPINALKRVGFEAADFKGTVKGTAEVRLGLISEQNPPEPAWKAHLDLAGVDLAKPFSGRKIDNLNAALDVDPRAAHLEGKADIDGVPMELAVTEPVEDDPEFRRERHVKVVLDDKAGVRHFAPGLDQIIDGPVTVELDRIDEKRQAVSADLSRAALTVPWLGWTKGAGIAAKVKFEVTDGEKQSVIDKFVLDGDGFGVSGAMTVGKNGLVSADLSRVRLSPSDDYSVVVRQAKGGYQVAVNGKSADVRSLIDRMKSPGEGGDGDAGADPSVRIDGKLDRMIGFGDETLSNVTLDYASRSGKLSALDFSAITAKGQAVVGQMRRPSGLGEVSVTSGDAGAVARFANLYSRMNGGLLNLKMKENANGIWNGSVDLRNFSLDNEQRLQSIVSTPADADGRSLNKAVKRDIDVSSARFQRGFVRLIYSDGTLRIENGVVRGEQVGATFQGLVRDSQGRIDLTGTFMPAYGLNRLFAELPVIGILLGNGRDRGLLGITFKLTGATEQPKLVVNPLSIIAPGVFRQIFEFR